MAVEIKGHPKAQQTQDLTAELKPELKPDGLGTQPATWLFGYGSLIWKPELPYIQAQPARVKGYVRRFWQGSEDHRGTPEAPGRVVTLVPDAQEYCYGVAYLVSNVEIERTFAQLDHREKNGYTRLTLSLNLASEDTFANANVVRGITYIADDSNQAYLGHASTTQIAKQIFHSIGPSGTNTEYLLELAQALRDRNIDDPHVFTLEAEVQGLLHQG